MLLSLVVRVVDVVVLLWCFGLLRWWGPLVDFDDTMLRAMSMQWV